MFIIALLKKQLFCYKENYFLLMINIIEQHLPEIQQLMREYGVQRAYAFGSVLRNNMNADSDIDFIIRLPDNMDYETYANNYFKLATALEILLKKKGRPGSRRNTL